MTTIPVDFENPTGPDPEPPIPFPEADSEAHVEMSEALAFQGGAPAQYQYMGFQQPIFDSEYVIAGTNEIRFFQRQIGMHITPEEKNILLRRSNFAFCGSGNRLLLQVPLRCIYENKRLRDLRRADGQTLPAVILQRRPEQPVDFPTPEFSGPDAVSPHDFQEDLMTSLDIYDRCYRLFPNPDQRMRINHFESFQANIRWAEPLPSIRRLRLECYMVGTLLVPR